MQNVRIIKNGLLVVAIIDSLSEQIIKTNNSIIELFDSEGFYQIIEVGQKRIDTEYNAIMYG